MIKSIVAVAAIATASLAFATVAQAEDIPATPMNHGPMMMHGMGPAGEIFNLGMTPVNIVARPVIDATGAVVGATATAMNEPAAAPMMVKHHHHHRMMRHKHMMKKHMMMKKKMM